MVMTFVTYMYGKAKCYVVISEKEEDPTTTSNYIMLEILVEMATNSFFNT